MKINYAKTTAISTFLCMTFSLPVLADSSGNAFYDHATVLSSEPIYTVERRPVEEKECWDEITTYDRHGSAATGVIAGGIIGGIIGNQFGKGHGKQAATVAGTLLGGSIGHDLARSEPRTYQVTEERCRVYRRYEEQERISGYSVTYRYDGHTFTRILSHDPGRHLKLRIHVEPVD